MKRIEFAAKIKVAAFERADLVRTRIIQNI